MCASSVILSQHSTLSDYGVKYRESRIVPLRVLVLREYRGLVRCYLGYDVRVDAGGAERVRVRDVPTPGGVTSKALRETLVLYEYAWAC